MSISVNTASLIAALNWICDWTTITKNQFNSHSQTLRTASLIELGLALLAVGVA